MSFFTKFKQLCDENGTSPNAVGRLIEVSSGSITNWKNGSIPNSETLNKLAEYFDVSIDYLLGREEQPKPEVDEETRVKQEIFDKYKVLFSTSKNLSHEQLQEMFVFMEKMFGDKNK